MASGTSFRVIQLDWTYALFDWVGTWFGFTSVRCYSVSLDYISFNNPTAFTYAYAGPNPKKYLPTNDG